MQNLNQIRKNIVAAQHEKLKAQKLEFLDLLDQEQFAEAIEFVKKDQSGKQKFLRAGINLFLKYLKDPQQWMLGLYFIRLLKHKNIKHPDEIEKAMEILYQNINQCRNPIFILVLMTEISSGDQRDLYYRSAVKIEKQMFSQFGEEYVTFMLEKDWEGRDVLQIVQKNELYKMIASKSVEKVLYLQWFGPYEDALLPTEHSYLIQYVKYPENFQKQGVIPLKREKPFWLRFKNFFMAIYIRFYFYFICDAFVCFYIGTQVAKTLSYVRGLDNDEAVSYDIENGASVEAEIFFALLYSSSLIALPILNMAAVYLKKIIMSKRIILYWFYILIIAVWAILYNSLLDSKLGLDPSEQKNALFILATIWIIVLQIRLVFLLQLTQSFGMNVLIMLNMWHKVLVFGFLIACILIIFSSYFYLLQFNLEWTRTFGDTTLYMFNVILQNSYTTEDLNELDPISCFIFVLYLGLTRIVLLSLLVAILSSYFAEVEASSDTQIRDVRIRFIKFWEFSPDYSILTVLYTPFTVFAVLLLPFIFASRTFARKAGTVLMYAFYTIFILPIAYCYFLVCEAIFFVPCYLRGVISIATAKIWPKLIVWIVFGPLILLLGIFRGSYHFFRNMLEFPEHHLIERKTLSADWAIPMDSGNDVAENKDRSQPVHKESNTLEDWKNELEKEDSKKTEPPENEPQRNPDQHMRPDPHSVAIVTKTIEKIKSKKPVNENLLELKENLTNMKGKL